MLASTVRTLVDDIAPELSYAGVRMQAHSEPGAAYWNTFEELTVALLDALR